MTEASFVTTITRTVTLKINLEKLTPEIIQECNDTITYIGDTPEEHFANIAEHYNRGNWDMFDTFLEGYGDLKEFDVEVVKDTLDDVNTEKMDY
ncbi:hypothetical protein EVB81_184 [Rhizobium phage RHph_I46]|uniref:Uncharacterized protein n=1 Tax=Rhizobium phage RHph_I1_9 TaxID=2509729 RepID=A0A7S5UWS8_9CAUD|nr:hypothetical protein PP936_gp183 [Rhizobium phage RHph_I1_9]QIG69753.1 hypothetical protein EVB81_184 [Rhizobium phage RHph_I46]QIG71034.1 hypothetical protein EVB92_184 [Rhizobium phage RHph_I9]QIG73620.1 hypothetical protein EVC04_183 [Rhizobium phage RHph_I1_9]QIG76373.1 hypothetical protein EVC25_184 [Rhizobium phage RHph_I34]